MTALIDSIFLLVWTAWVVVLHLKISDMKEDHDALVKCLKQTIAVEDDLDRRLTRLEKKEGAKP